MRSLLFATVVLVATSLATAQEFVGLNNNCSVGFTTRGSLSATAGAGELMNRIESSEIAGYCTSSVPGSRAIGGVELFIQDQDAVATSEVFDVKVYSEDPTNPGFPQLSTGVTAATGIAGPAAPATGTTAAAYHSITFATPVTVPNTGDVFLSIGLPTAPGWNLDGLSVQGYFGQVVAGFAIYDLPNNQQLTPGTTAALSYTLTYTAATGLMNYNSSRCLHMDVMGVGVNGGVVGAITNQVSFTPSNVAPGTASPFSAHHPDALATPRTAGRADDVSYTIFDSVRPAGSLVFFLVDLGTFAPEVPLATLIPGSTGVACLHFATMSSAGLGFLAGGSASKVTVVPAAARAAIAGLPLLQQGLVFDVATNAVHAGPCGWQIF